MQILSSRNVSHLPILLLNFIGFEIVWFLLVSKGDTAVWLGALFIAVHCFFHRKRSGELLLVLSVALLGYALDSLLTTMGIFAFELGDAYFAPIWLLTLWGAFACTINHSLSFLKHSRLAAVVLSAIFAPISYYVGVEFGAVTFPFGDAITLVLLSCVWAVFLPFCFWLSNQIKEQS